MLEGIESRLKAKGITKTEGTPEVYVSVFGTTRDEVRIDTDYWGYRPGPYWRWYGPSPAMETLI